MDLDSAAEQVLNELSAEIRDGRAQVTVERPLGRVSGYDLPLRHVLSNLISNALKFVPEGIEPEVRI